MGQQENEYYKQFLQQHMNQLVESGVPKHFWPKLYEKLTQQTFDCSETFMLIMVEYEDSQKFSHSYQIQVNGQDGIDCNDPKHIYLVDHAWTFRIEYARKQLLNTDNLRSRIGNMMGFNVLDEEAHKDEFVEKIMGELWKHVNFYSIGNAKNVEDRLPVWYIMDEVGNAMKHSDDPNCRMVPFIHLPENMAYSLIFPIKKMNHTDLLTRDFVENRHGNERDTYLLPWYPQRFTNRSCEHKSYDAEYFLGGHIKESMSALTEKAKISSSVLKVFSEYKYINKYLKAKEFEMTDQESEADILWYLSHYKQFEELSLDSPHKFINQFPFEYILTVKDLLPIVSRMLSPRSTPKWLPITYNLHTELNEFISYFQRCEDDGKRNYWIIKPFNLARSLDTYITDNLDLIIRLVATGPKIAQKYVERPVLFEWPESGRVKFDVRYVILLKSVKPLGVYVYKNFFLRFANKQFSLDDFDDYEKHFTVMNYDPAVCMKHILCAHFKAKWEEQYPTYDWKTIEHDIIEMLGELFTAATHKEPPFGIGANPQSRALYAVDILLEWSDAKKIQPKLLEVNWMPDCKRACEYYPGFYNDIFKLLFLDVKNESLFYEIN